MAPYARWVHLSFKQTLIDACDEFLERNDCGTDKKHTEVIKRVSKDITDIAVVTIKFLTCEVPFAVHMELLGNI